MEQFIAMRDAAIAERKMGKKPVFTKSIAPARIRPVLKVAATKTSKKK
jgi:hypothetical protein